MIGYAFWLLGRMVVVAFALVTWAYCASTYSPFAFDMFVRPRLFPWLETFVDWHHVWYAAAYVVSVITLLPDLIGSRARANKTAWIAAISHVVVFLAIGVMLLGSPYLRLLSTSTRGPATAFVALVPLVWLAVIDVLATRPRLLAATADPESTEPRQLLTASLTATLVIWAMHFIRALVQDRGLLPDGLALVSAAWSLALDLSAYAILFVVLSLTIAVARTRRRPAAWEFGIGAALVAIGVTEFFRRLVFPSLAFTDADTTNIAIVFGVAIAATWAGFRLRRASFVAGTNLDIALLLSPALRSRVWIVIILAALPLAALTVESRFEAVDWDFLLQKSVTLLEGLIVFGLALRLQSSDRRPLSPIWIVAVPAVAVGLMAAIPMTTRSADVVRDRYAVVDPAFRLTSDAFINRRTGDPAFATALIAAAQRSLEPIPSMPSIDFVAKAAPPQTPPNIFLFVIDGLRRDYLSPYNESVRFTPAIGAWARDALVFQNGFTKFGGTWLAMPSIWSGAPVRRGWTRGGFDRLNSLERLIVTNNYRFAINDFTVEGQLKPDTARTFIDPGVKSVNTDICSNVAAIQKLLPAGGSPLFSFVAPMNVYTLNSSHSAVVNDPASPYNGFSSGYAANVSRVDRCFGDFIAFLKQSGIYDNSIIAITADHGESLGEDGNYGHQFFLFPEDVRIPLIISIPPRLRPTLTTDLGRIAFSSDLVPTLYRLLGNEVRDLGDQFGAPLVTDVARELPSRRRQSYLLMSSYGASYGMLRRNGKFLHIADLINYREYGFSLFKQPVGTKVRVTDDLRRVNQALIRRQMAGIEAFYSPH